MSGFLREVVEYRHSLADGPLMVEAMFIAGETELSETVHHQRPVLGFQLDGSTEFDQAPYLSLAGSEIRLFSHAVGKSRRRIRLKGNVRPGDRLYVTLTLEVGKVTATVSSARIGSVAQSMESPTLTAEASVTGSMVGLDKDRDFPKGADGKANKDQLAGWQTLKGWKLEGLSANGKQLFGDGALDPPGYEPPKTPDLPKPPEPDKEPDIPTGPDAMQDLFTIAGMELHKASLATARAGEMLVAVGAMMRPKP